MVIHRPQPDEPTAQLALFKLGNYHYQVLVTNLPLPSLNLWRSYNGRGGAELLIKEIRGSAHGSIRIRHVFTNETYFHLLLLAYNLINCFKHSYLRPEYQNAALQTLRHKILQIPAQFHEAENQPSLILPASGPQETAWRYAMQQIQRLKP